MPEAPVLTLVWEAGPEDLRPPAHGQPGRGGGVRMTDTSVMQDRIGQLCGQFKLPTMGAQSVARFTAAGHGDALATFLEVLEQEAEDRRHRRITGCAGSPGCPRARPGKPSSTAVACRCGSNWAGPGQLRGARHQRAGLRTARHRQGSALRRPGPPPEWKRATPSFRSGLPFGRSGAFFWTCPELRKLDNFDFLLLTTWATCPRAPGIGSSSPHRRTLRAPRGHHVKPGLGEWERIFANPMATAAASTGCPSLRHPGV